MENFKQIAEDCLAGKLSGTFINRRGDIIPSGMLHKFDSIKYPYVYWENNCITRKGNYFYNEEKISDYDIIDFIPDMKKEQITIDIPEGMVAVQETVNGEIRIKFIDKELTYEDIVKDMDPKLRILPFATKDTNTVNDAFFDKVNILRKLTNIRNYFGKPKHLCDGIVIKCTNSYCGVETGQFYFDKPDLDSLHEIVFAEREHAEQAIKLLGDELKYLFEPW